MRVKDYVLLGCAICMMSFVASAQLNETIRSDRPGRGSSPFAVGRYVLQVQAGVDAGAFQGEGTYSLSGNSLVPGTVLRFGISNNLELNAAYEYRSDYFSMVGSSFRMSGLSLHALGTRINLRDGNGKGPNIGLQLTMRLPYISRSYDARYIAPQVTLLANQSIGKKVSVLLNTGVSYSGNDAVPTGLYVLNVGYALSRRLGVYAESYGSLTGNRAEIRTDGGLAYLVNNNLQLDIYGGGGKNYRVTDYFVSMGMSWRIRTKKNRL
jgi:hypothetical protein